MVKSQNMARHIKSEHPNSETETNFVPCLVPAKYLRQLQNQPPPPPPPPQPPLPVSTPPQMDPIDLMDFYYELIRKVRAKAKVNCSACLRNQTSENNNNFFEANLLDITEHMNGCAASTGELIVKYLPGILSEPGMPNFDSTNLIRLTHNVEALMAGGENCFINITV